MSTSSTSPQQLQSGVIVTEAKSEQSSSKTDASEGPDITDLLRVCRDAGVVLEEWQVSYLEKLLTTMDPDVVLRYMRRPTRFSTVIGKILSEQPST